jgi:hypothetical protein
MKRQGSLSLMGEAVIVELQNEARREELMGHRVDDDLPNVPEVDALTSAQSRRAATALSK